VAGFVAERAVVGRSARRGGGNIYGLGQVHGPHQLVDASDGVQLYVEVDEPSRRPAVTVVLVHGYALNLDSWHFQRLGLRGSQRLVLYDQRSHGRSGRDLQIGERELMPQLAADLRSVIEATTASGPVVLIGHSLGGMTVMALAEHHPQFFGERVLGVGLLSTSSGHLDDVSLGMPSVLARPVRHFVPQLVAAAGRNAGLVERGRRMSTDLGVLLTRIYAFGGPTPSELSDFTLEMINATPVSVLTAFYPLFVTFDGTAGLRHVQGAEALVLVGEHDKLTPPSHSQRIVQQIPHAELVTLDPGGHLVMLERPDDVNDWLFDLVDRSVARVGSRRRGQRS